MDDSSILPAVIFESSLVFAASSRSYFTEKYLANANCSAFYHRSDELSKCLCFPSKTLNYRYVTNVHTSGERFFYCGILYAHAQIWNLARFSQIILETHQEIFFAQAIALFKSVLCPVPIGALKRVSTRKPGRTGQKVIQINSRNSL